MFEPPFALDAEPLDAVPLDAVLAVPDERPAVDFAGRFAAPVSPVTGAEAVFAAVADDLVVVVLPTVEEGEVDVRLPTVSAAVAGARRAAWLAVDRAGFAAPGTAEVRVPASGLARRTPAVDETGAGRVACACSRSAVE